MKKEKCKNCYGKGYFTDFIEDKNYIVAKARIIISLCGCERGRKLQKYFSIKKKFKP